MKHFCTILIIILVYVNIVECNAITMTLNYAVTRGTTIRMRCIIPNALQDEPLITGYVQWIGINGKLENNPRLKILETGQLQILHTNEQDSGIYYCMYRSPDALKHHGAMGMVFEHRLVVYEVSGHKFQTQVKFDVTTYGPEETISLLKVLLKEVCESYQLCTVGAVTTDKCEISDRETEVCDITMNYEATETPTSTGCDKFCVRDGMIERLKKAQTLLEAVLVAQTKDPRSHMKLEMRVFETKQIKICKAGYQLIHANLENCFPCLPGTYSETESQECDSCPVGYYQEKFGRPGCEQCPDSKTTEAIGSMSRHDCKATTNIGVWHDIKHEIVSFFSG